MRQLYGSLRWKRHGASRAAEVHIRSKYFGQLALLCSQGPAKHRPNNYCRIQSGVSFQLASSTDRKLEAYATVVGPRLRRFDRLAFFERIPLADASG